MIKSKKQMFIVIGAFALVLTLLSVTYAFFNYTRTGTANIIKTGRINFNSEQGTSINLTNMFPIDVTNGIPNDNTKVGTVTINVTGDTTYDEGIEYKVSAVNVQNTVGNKSLPISLDVSVTNNSINDPATTLGTSDEEYFDNRGGNTSIYRVLAKDAISNNEELLVGYIAKGATGVDGNIVIKAYLDKAKIAISDTYPEGDVTHTEGEEPNQTTVTDYTNGTTDNWVGDRTVFTTTEWNSLQQDGVSFQVKVEANEGIWVDEIRSINVMDDHSNISFLNDNYNKIIKVIFAKMSKNNMQSRYDVATIKQDITANNEGKVLSWLEPDQVDNTKYIMYVVSDGDTYITDGKLFGSWATKVEEIQFNNINTSRLTDMSDMFYRCEKLKNLNLSSFNTENVLDMSRMFWNCNELETIDLTSFDTSNVQIMDRMFSNCNKLLSIDLHNFNTENVTSMMYMFNSCSSLTSLDLSNFNTENVTTMTYMFYGCSEMITLDISGFDVSNLSSSGGMPFMFQNCSALTTIYVSSSWDASNQPDSMPIFTGATSLVGGNGTTYDSSKTDKNMAVIDTPSTPGYLTDVADKPTS